MRDRLSVWCSPRKRLLPALVLGAVLSLWAVHLAHGQQATDPAAIWDRFVEALNRGDVAGASSVFADDAIFQQANGACATPCIGRAAIVPALKQLVAGGPLFNTLPGAQIVQGNYVGQLRSTAASGVTTVPFTLAAAGESMEALRFDAAAVGRLMSAGTGGLIGLTPPVDEGIAALSIGGSVLAGLGILLLVLSLARTDRSSNSGSGSAAVRPFAAPLGRRASPPTQGNVRSTFAVRRVLDRRLRPAFIRSFLLWRKRERAPAWLRDSVPARQRAAPRYMLPRAPA